jgi:leucyl aminopeptidase (aminopeptidase T)
VTNVASLRKRPDVLVICGPHNKMLAEYIMLESQRVGAHPHLWTFDEDFYLRSLEADPEILTTKMLGYTCGLVEKAQLVIWLSQFADVRRFPANVQKTIYYFWDRINEAVEHKPRLYVNLPSPKLIRTMRINYLEFLSAFINGVKVDYHRLRETGSALASRLHDKEYVRIFHENGTDLKMRIQDRRVAFEAGTLEDCYSSGSECSVDVPAGEVYVAPVEDSTNGVVVVDEHKEYRLKRLELHFQNGRLVEFNAQSGSEIFRKMLAEAEGEKDRIGEFGIGTNYEMKPVGWSIYDEKALGTAHVAIGRNVHLRGVNQASIHVDFVLNKPSIEVDGKLIMRKGKVQG